jgi:plastocyanin
LRKLIVTLAVASLLAALAVAAAGAATAAPDSPQVKAAATKVAKVRDNFFSAHCKTIKHRLTCTIHRNDILEWRWTPDPGLTETNAHNVTGLYKGNTAFASEDKVDGTYRKKFRRAGRTYKVLCTLHPENMRMNVVVIR